MIFVVSVSFMGAGAAAYAYATTPASPLTPAEVAAAMHPIESSPLPKAVKSQYEVTANDTGKTYTYPVGVHFSVFLDEEHYPKNELVCHPGGVIAHAANMPVATLPLYAVRFDTVAPGICTLHNKDFSMTVVVEGAEQ
jgi:hypothetical protein